MYILNKLLSFPELFFFFFSPKFEPFAKKLNALKRCRNGESAETLFAFNMCSQMWPEVMTAELRVSRNFGDEGRRRKPERGQLL